MTVLVLMEPGAASKEMLTAARKFGAELSAVQMDAVQRYAPDAIAALLALVAERLNASAVLAAGTDRGNDVMARLAARTGLPFAANCVVVIYYEYGGRMGFHELPPLLRWRQSRCRAAGGKYVLHSSPYVLSATALATDCSLKPSSSKRNPPLVLRNC